MIVVWRVTGKCNLGCPFCAHDKNLPGKRLDVAEQQVRAFAPALSEYAALTGRKPLVSWIGGEPLIWAPVFPLSKWMSDELGLDISATTNGTLLDRPKIRSEILSSFTELTISVDGFEKFHNQMRGRPMSWSGLKASVLRLSEERAKTNSRLKLRANIVLMRGNFEEFPALCRELANWGFDEVTFNQLGGRDRPEFFPANRLLPEQVSTLGPVVNELKQTLSAKGVILCGNDRYVERLIASANDVRIPVSDCGPGKDFLFIDEYGRVSPCNFVSDSHYVDIGSLVDADSILKLPETFFSGLETSRPAVCSDCPSTRAFEKFDEMVA